MTDNVKGRPARRTERPEDTFNTVDCTPSQDFSVFDLDALLDEIASILAARTARLEGMLAQIGASRE